MLGEKQVVRVKGAQKWARRTRIRIKREIGERQMVGRIFEVETRATFFRGKPIKCECILVETQNHTWNVDPRPCGLHLAINRRIR